MKTVCIFLGENTLYRMDFFVRPYGCFCDFLQRTLQSWSTFLTKSSKIFRLWRFLSAFSRKFYVYNWTKTKFFSHSK